MNTTHATEMLARKQRRNERTPGFTPIASRGAKGNRQIIVFPKQERKVEAIIPLRELRRKRQPIITEVIAP